MSNTQAEAAKAEDELLKQGFEKHVTKTGKVTYRKIKTEEEKQVLRDRLVEARKARYEKQKQVRLEKQNEVQQVMNKQKQIDDEDLEEFRKYKKQKQLEEEAKQNEERTKQMIEQNKDYIKQILNEYLKELKDNGQTISKQEKQEIKEDIQNQTLAKVENKDIQSKQEIKKEVQDQTQKRIKKHKMIQKVIPCNHPLLQNRVIEEEVSYYSDDDQPQEQ